MTTTMWEVRAEPATVADLLAWVRPRVPDRAALYRSAGDEHRVVVIDPTGTVARLLADLPAHLAARPPHAWDFEPI